MQTERILRTRSGRKHILLIEDNDDGRESLRMLLSYLGYRVDVAANGVEGVRLALENHPDVAIVDIGLPLLDGFQVARRIRKVLGKEIRLIAYTAYSGPETEDQAFEAGFDAHLVKPVEVSELTSWLGDTPRMPSVLCSN